MFESLFTHDPRHNQSLWTRSRHNPVVSTAGGDWCRDFLSDSTVLELDGQLAMYVEGSAGGVEQVGLFTARLGDAAAEHWTPYPGNPIVHAGPEIFDRGSAFDPAVVRFGGRYLLYYSATKTDAHALAEALERGTLDPADVDDGGETIGLAMSPDGYNFTKWPSNPVMPGRCPHLVEHRGTLYLYFVRIVHDWYRVFLATSADGFTFTEVTDNPVLSVGESASWDALTVTTPKIFAEDGKFYMLYAGGRASLDDPTGIGLAMSDDLVHWTKFPGNPIFTVGPAGTFDSASVASPILRQCSDGYYLFYAGSDRSIKDGLHSQVGVAALRIRSA